MVSRMNHIWIIPIKYLFLNKNLLLINFVCFTPKTGEEITILNKREVSNFQEMTDLSYIHSINNICIIKYLNFLLIPMDLIIW